MTENSGKKSILFEEAGQYSIEVFPERNRIKFIFTGDLKKKEDIPKYVEHSRKAIELVKEGYTLMSEVIANGAPGLAASADIKEGLKILKSKKVLGTAVVLDPKKVLQRLTLNVVSKMSGMNVKTFTKLEEAETWLTELAANAVS
ncbi:MAG: STAS/SEC14 domain-containing protein [Candidatus Aminicenantes bacterium]|nr:STAS/SEC14 domain-containing protein [Candidatus Aminicenantes bacterium]